MKLVRFIYDVPVEEEEQGLTTDAEVIEYARESLEELIAQEGLQAEGEIVPYGEES